MVLSAAYAHLNVRHFNGNGVAAPVLPVSGSCPAKFDPMRVMKEKAAGAFMGDTAVTTGGCGPCSALTAAIKHNASAENTKKQRANSAWTVREAARTISEAVPSMLNQDLGDRIRRSMGCRDGVFICNSTAALKSEEKIVINGTKLDCGVCVQGLVRM
jgi:hypothetical protein